MERGDRGPVDAQRAGTEAEAAGTPSVCVCVCVLGGGVAAGALWPLRSTARSGEKGGGAQLDPSPGVRTRALSKPRGMKDSRSARNGEGFGEAQGPQLSRGLPGGPGKLGTLSATHTLVGRFCSAHSSASSSSRTPGRATSQTHTHTYIHPSICEHRHTSRTPAPTGAQSPSSESGFSACTIDSRDIQPVAIDSYNTVGCDTEQCQTHKHNLVPSCTNITATVRQMNAQNLAPYTYR